jgi:hypothetical protein
MKYRVMWNYKSSLAGPWKKGDEVEMEAGMAERVNEDSPGVLFTLTPALSLEGGGSEAMEAAPADRMVKRAKKRGA